MINLLTETTDTSFVDWLNSANVQAVATVCIIAVAATFLVKLIKGRNK